MSVNNVLDLLLRESRGTAVLCNIVDCLDEELLTPEVVQEFLTAVSVAVDQENPNTPNQLIGLMSKVARGTLPVSSPSRSIEPASFLCRTCDALPDAYELLS